MEVNSLTKAEWQAGISLASVYVLRMLGLFMVIPVIAVAAKAYPDYSPLWVGLAIGGYGLTQAIFQIPMGLLSDKWGRKPVIYLGLILFAIGSLIAGLADSMWLLTIGRIIQGSGAIAGAIMALASDVTRESQRTKIMALIGISIGFSFYIALLLGPIIAASLGMQGIFLITAGFALLCIPLVRLGINNKAHLAPSGDSLPKTKLLSGLFKHPHLWRLNWSVLVVHLLITCFFVQVPVMLININVPLSDHWVLYSLVLFASVIGLIGMVKLADHLPVSLSFRLALLFMASAFVLLLILAPSWSGIAVAGILFFTGFNFLEAKMPAMVSSISPAGSKGSAMGIYASHQFFGAFLGGLLSGLLNSYFSPEYTFIMCLVVIFLLSLIAKGLTSTQQIKRVTLKLENRHKESQNLLDLRDKINSMAGVQEVVADPIENAMYLKVDAKIFEIDVAEALIKEQN
ncbi:MAG: MFS family permease [Alphaproteobacteria bacterium]|jgi:MFS family permease